jgi:integrase
MGRSRAEVVAKLRATQNDLAKGVLPVDARMTVKSYFDQWLTDMRPSLDYKSYRLYERLIRLYLVPRIGKLALCALTPAHLNRVYAELLDKGYSHTSVRLAHRTMKQVLIHAVKHDVLARNVALLATPPKPVKREMVFLSQEEAGRLLQAAIGTSLEALWLVALSTGMRLGELLALQWATVNLKQKTIRIIKSLSRQPRADGGLTPKEPKTASSIRTIPITAEVAEALRQHKLRQVRMRLQAGPVWVDNDLVFASQVGTYLRDTNVRDYTFHRLLKKAGLPHMRFHDLRHTAATLLLVDGVSPLAVSKMLGHATVSMTLDLYGHVTKSMEDAVTASMGRILFGGKLGAKLGAAGGDRAGQ